jgi:hypothetical protein
MSAACTEGQGCQAEAHAEQPEQPMENRKQAQNCRAGRQQAGIGRVGGQAGSCRRASRRSAATWQCTHIWVILHALFRRQPHPPPLLQACADAALLCVAPHRAPHLCIAIGLCTMQTHINAEGSMSAARCQLACCQQNSNANWRSRPGGNRGKGRSGALPA